MDQRRYLSRQACLGRARGRPFRCFLSSVPSGALRAWPLLPAASRAQLLELQSAHGLPTFQQHQNTFTHNTWYTMMSQAVL